MSIEAIISFALFIAIISGGLLWRYRRTRSDRPKSSLGIPDIYTAGNVHRHMDHYVEENGMVQAFIVTAIDRSGYFFVEVLPPGGQEFNRCFLRIRGWARELSSERLVTKHCLLDEIPLETSFDSN